MGKLRLRECSDLPQGQKWWPRRKRSSRPLESQRPPPRILQSNQSTSSYRLLKSWAQHARLACTPTCGFYSFNSSSVLIPSANAGIRLPKVILIFQELLCWRRCALERAGIWDLTLLLFSPPSSFTSLGFTCKINTPNSWSCFKNQSNDVFECIW